MIDAATKTTGTRSAQSDPLYDNYVWQSPRTLFEHQPTVRLDYNLTDNHRLSGSWSFDHRQAHAGLPEQRRSAVSRARRTSATSCPRGRSSSMSLRSVLSKNIVNELRGGLTAFCGGSNFGYPSSIASRNDPEHVRGLRAASRSPRRRNTTDWYTSNGPSWRTAPTYSIDDTLTWQNGRAHDDLRRQRPDLERRVRRASRWSAASRSGSTRTSIRRPACSTPTNFPGASSAQLTAARATYAVLTGRVASVTSQAVLDGDTGKYVELGADARSPGGIKVYGIFAQDSWRLQPNLTLTGGLRYDVQTPFAPITNVMSAVTMASVCGMSGLGDGGLYSKCNFLQPGATGGARSGVHPAREGHRGLQDRLEQLRAVGEHRLAARTCSPASCARSSAIPTRRRCAPATRWPTSARA